MAARPCYAGAVAGRLLLALGFTIYILIGIAYEARDLIGHYGETYIEYRRKIGMVVPGLGLRA